MRMEQELQIDYSRKSNKISSYRNHGSELEEDKSSINFGHLRKGAKRSVTKKSQINTTTGERGGVVNTSYSTAKTLESNFLMNTEEDYYKDNIHGDDPNSKVRSKINIMVYFFRYFETQ